jgi:hypothetical protein
VDEAIAILRPHADGDRYTADRMIALLIENDRLDEAVAALRQHADVSVSFHARRLADLLAESGRIDEAVSVLRFCADAGDLKARRLVDLFALGGSIDALRARADAGDSSAIRRLTEVIRWGAWRFRDGDL